MISILNYGLGNLASITNMLSKVGVESRIISSPDEIRNSTSLILPGVGKFDHAMHQIDYLGIRTALDEAAKIKQIPILGICLGMQLMTNGSEEGEIPGLGWIDAFTRKFDGQKFNIRIPHMGWNLIKQSKSNPCFDGDEFLERRFYFVHSYAVECRDFNDILTTSEYGGEFVSSFAKNNLVGAQFHPEKSHKFGASFLKRFAEGYCDA